MTRPANCRAGLSWHWMTPFTSPWRCENCGKEQPAGSDFMMVLAEPALHGHSTVAWCLECAGFRPKTIQPGVFKRVWPYLACMILGALTWAALIGGVMLVARWL